MTQDPRLTEASTSHSWTLGLTSLSSVAAGQIGRVRGPLWLLSASAQVPLHASCSQPIGRTGPVALPNSRRRTWGQSFRGHHDLCPHPAHTWREGIRRSSHLCSCFSDQNKNKNSTKTSWIPNPRERMCLGSLVTVIFFHDFDLICRAPRQWAKQAPKQDPPENGPLGALKGCSELPSKDQPTRTQDNRSLL